MSRRLSRRTLLKTAGAAALVPGNYRPSALPVDEGSASGAPSVPRPEGAQTPKICLEAGAAAGADEAVAAAAARRIRQLGVAYVIAGGGPIPWDESRLRTLMDRLKQNGLTLANLMIAGFPNAIY